MLSSSYIYGKYLQDYMINDEQLSELKQVVLMMLKDLHNICEEVDIKYSLAFGSMLGAVRHKGFIPWDDDIDVFMLRKDLPKLEEIINEKYSDKYYILSRKVNKKYNLPFVKLMRKDTTLVEVSHQNKGISGAFIDIFLLDEAPKTCVKLRQKYYMICSWLASLECDFKYPPQILKEYAKNYKELKKYVFERRFMGFFASILPISAWCKLRDLSLKGKKLDDKYVCSGDVFRYIDKTYFDNLSLYEFEGEKFYGPTDYDGCLSKIYKNYMELPPVDKREHHVFIDLDMSKVLNKE